MKPEEKLGEILRTRGLTIAVAESCTGGLLGSRITDVHGASDYFRGGVIAYQNDVKKALLGVPETVLATVGAVSEETARAMAHGARVLLKSDIGVGITGIAGPGGGTPDKPVGLVYIGVEGPRGAQCRRFRWSGTRVENKASSAAAALELVLELIRAESI